MGGQVLGGELSAGVSDGVAVDGCGVRVHGGVQLDESPSYEHLAHRTTWVVPTC